MNRRPTRWWVAVSSAVVSPEALPFSYESLAFFEISLVVWAGEHFLGALNEIRGDALVVIVIVVISVGKTLERIVFGFEAAEIHHLDASGKGLVLAFLLTAHIHFLLEVHGPHLWVLAKGVDLFISLTLNLFVGEPGTIASFPFGSTNDAKFMSTGWACHMVTSFRAFDHSAAFAALLPTIFFGGLNKCIYLWIFGTVCSGGMVFAITLGTNLPLAFRALAVDSIAVLVFLDMFWLYPGATAPGRTVEAIFGGPLCIFGVPDFAKRSVE